MTIAPTGSILINTTTDDLTHKLQVNGGISSTSLTSPTIGAATGSALSLQSNGTTHLTLDTSGNVGLGTTPQTGVGAAIEPFFQVGHTLISDGLFSENTYYDGSTYRYIATDYATRFVMNAGAMFFLTAPSGTAGSPTPFTQALTLQNNGHLLVGTTTDNGTDIAQFNGSISIVGQATIQGITIGLGGGAVISNTAVGNVALYSNTTGYNNTASGQTALYSNTTGNANTSYGFQAGYGTGTNANTTGSSNIFLGYETVGAGAADTNEIVIGAGAVGLGSNTTVIGNSSTVKTKTYGVTTLAAYTVATLPAGVIGDTAYVTDATNPSYLGTLTGGGAVKTPVFYNGTAWVSY